MANVGDRNIRVQYLGSSRSNVVRSSSIANSCVLIAISRMETSMATVTVESYYEGLEEKNVPVIFMTKYLAKSHWLMNHRRTSFWIELEQ